MCIIGKDIVGIFCPGRGGFMDLRKTGSRGEVESGEESLGEIIVDVFITKYTGDVRYWES